MIDKIMELVGRTTPMELVAGFVLAIIAIIVVIMLFGDVRTLAHELLFRSWLRRNRNYARFSTRKEAEDAFEREGSVKEYAKMVRGMRRR